MTPQKTLTRKTTPTRLKAERATSNTALTTALIIELQGDSEKHNTAIVIMIRNRYYCYYKNNRIQTAWSLPGAKLFNLWDISEITKTTTLLESKGKTYKLYKIGITK